MNTQIEYTYTDGNNYSSLTTAIVAGELTADDEQAIFSTLEDALYFIPSHVGLPEFRPSDWDTYADHNWYKLEANAFSKTDDDPTVPMTADELKNDFLSVRHWETDMPRRKMVTLRIVTGEQPILKQFIIPVSWGSKELNRAVEQAHRMELEGGNYVKTEDISMDTFAALGMIPCLLPTINILRRNLRQEAMDADGISVACCNACIQGAGSLCDDSGEPIEDFDSHRLCCRCDGLYDVSYMPGEKQAWKSKRFIINKPELLQDPFKLYTILAKYDSEIAAALEAGFAPMAEDISLIED